MRVVEYWFDETEETVETDNNSWTPPFNLSDVDCGYYVKVEGDTSAMGEGEFEVSQ